MQSQLTRDQTRPDWPPSPWQRPLVRVGFLISALALLVFLGLAAIILQQLPLMRFDTSVALYLQQHTTRLGMRSMRLVSGLADPGVPLMGMIGVVLLAVRRRWADLALWVVALGGGLLINSSIKDFFDGRRPAWADPLHMGHQWQFPSGHVLGATIGYGLIVLLLWHRFDRPRLRSAFVLGLVALLLLIGFSRLYVRDHYLGDVLAGYALGLSWLALCAGVWAAYRPQRGVLQ
ncbi:MAG: phosphatase PAP2 family protein [Roseiflexaceae bacterium]